jgi:hypothetical protein
MKCRFTKTAIRVAAFNVLLLALCDCANHAGQSRAIDPGAPELLHANFEAQPLGIYTATMLPADFKNALLWNNGLDEGRAAIAQEGGNKFMRVTYAGNEFGPSLGGVQFKVPFSRGYDELYFSYRVRFARGFDFVKGGKLPGFMGGTGPTGCVSDRNGFSARNMWRTGGEIVQYLYAPRKKAVCGDDYHYSKGAEKQLFTPGLWQTVEHRLVMNTPGLNDGVMQAWVDGVLVLDIRDFLFREADASFSIDMLYFSTFFGGGDQSWAPKTAQVADFDELIVADRPISH